MEYRESYEEWLQNPYFDEATKEELRGIADDDSEIKERFYKELEFGTAGLRGVIGAGTNRMNIYTVRKATQGLANYIVKNNAQEKGVAIAYDSRQYVSGICGRSGPLSGSQWNQGIYFRIPAPDAGTVLCSPPPGMHCRHQYHRKPQSAGV